MAVDDYNGLQLDLGQLDESDFLQNMHLPPDNEGGIYSRFFKDHKNVTYSQTCLNRISRQPDNQQFVYTAHNSESYRYDLLLYSFLSTRTPEVKIKDEYINNAQISWTHNLGHGIIPSGGIYYNNDCAQAIGTHILDHNLQHNEKQGAGKREWHIQNIGSIPALEDWNTALPEVPLTIPQTYSFAERHTTAIPLFRRSSLDRVRFIYNFELDILKLLNMRIRAELKDADGYTIRDEDGNIEYGEWKVVKPNKKLIDCETDEFPIPQMYGRYSIITDDEKESLKDKDLVYYLEDNIAVPPGDACIMGKRKTLGMDSLEPVKYIFYMAQHTDAVKYGFGSNYTTNPFDLENGYSPISSIKSIDHGSTLRMKETERHIYNTDQYYLGKSAAFEEGYNQIYFGYGDKLGRSDSGIMTTSSTQIVLKLGETDPYALSSYFSNNDDDNNEIDINNVIMENENENNSQLDTYFVHLFMVVTRRIIFSPDKPVIMSSVKNKSLIQDLQ